MFRIVEFPSQGETLRGRFYTQPDSPKPSPIVIMAHGYSATITGMVADRYAELFSAAGFAVLLYDHHSFGISDGEPRHHVNVWIQARGFCDAMNFAATLPEIDSDRIALWGDSVAGGEVIVVGAIDSRVKAIIAQVPECADNPPPPDPDGKLFAAIRETFLHGDVSGTPQTTTGPMPVVSFDQHSVPSMLTTLTAFRWFIEYGGRHGTKWVNRVSEVAPDTPVPFLPALCAPHVKASLLMIIAEEDEMQGCDSRMARMSFDAAPQPKELVEVDGGHFGLLYYPSPLFDQAGNAQRDFLMRHLHERG